MSKVLITGTSRGLGRSLAKIFTEKKYDVIASARNIDDLKDLYAYKKISLDVTKEDQIKNAYECCGDIDILINNAVYSVSGPTEVIPIEEIKKEYETSVLGPLRMIRAFAPGMRENQKGTIVNISSAADRFAPPFGGSYSSAKAALAMMSEALRFELRHFGIKIILIEAGSIKTDLPLNQKHFTSADYTQLDNQMRKRSEEYFKVDKRPSPDTIAKLIIDEIEKPDSNFRIPIGDDAKYLISQHQKLSDKEWLEMPLYKGYDW